MHTYLPPVPDLKTYRELFAQDALWLPVMQVLCERHGLPASELQRCNLGSAIVYACQGRILKLFAPLWPEEFPRERLGLEACAHLSVPVPRLEAVGQLENWDYLIMQQLPGVSLGELWPQLKLPEQLKLLQQAGQIMRELHSLPPPPSPWTSQPWPEFVQTRLQAFAQQQRELGLSEAWIAQLLEWLQQHASALPLAESVLLHSDLTGDHFLVEQRQGDWQITGLIDFGDLMGGHWLYEFAAPLVFYTRGQPLLRHALLRAYGLEPATWPADLENHLLAAILLHRFVNIPYYLKHFCPAETQSLADLQAFFCSLEPR